MIAIPSSRLIVASLMTRASAGQWGAHALTCVPAPLRVGACHKQNARSGAPRRSSGSSTSSRPATPSATGSSSRPLPPASCARPPRSRPEVEGPARDVVEGRRPGLDRLVRRLGDRRRPAALALRQVRPHQEHRHDVQALHLDGLEGDRRVLELADDVHRELGHQPEGGARRRAQVRRRQGERPALRRRPVSRASPRRSTRSPRR